MIRNFLTKNWFVILMALVISSAFGIVSHAEVTLPRQISLLTLTEVYGSIFLSIILVYFYSEVRGIQEQQAQIQGDQTHLMRLEHEPKLVPEDWTAFRDRLMIDLTNIGGGFAQNTALEIIIQPINSEYTEPVSSKTPLEESFSRDKENMDREGNRTIGPEEVSRPFKSDEIKIGWCTVAEDGAIWRSRQGFSDQMDILKEEFGIKRMIFQVLLAYEDSTGKEHRTVIKTKDILLEEVDDFESALQDVGVPSPETGPLDEPEPFSMGERNVSFEEMEFVPRDK